MTSTPEHLDNGSDDDFVPTEELARRQGVKPITSVDDLAAEVESMSDELIGESIGGIEDDRLRRSADLKQEVDRSLDPGVGIGIGDKIHLDDVMASKLELTAHCATSGTRIP